MEERDMSEFIEPVATLDEAHEFMAELREGQKREGLWLAYSPFSQRVFKGEAPREEIGEWCKQFFLALTHFHRGAHSRPRTRLTGLRPEYKKFFWENRIEEEYGRSCRIAAAGRGGAWRVADRHGNGEAQRGDARGDGSRQPYPARSRRFSARLGRDRRARGNEPRSQHGDQPGAYETLRHQQARRAVLHGAHLCRCRARRGRRAI